MIANPQHWGGRTVLVTGAGGFMGSHLAERLVTLGARVRAFVRYNSSGYQGRLDASPRKRDMEIVPGDIQDRDSVRRAMEGVDTVFHLAALVGIPYSYDNPVSYVRTNVEGTLNMLLEAGDAGAARFVHTSTSEVYGSARFIPMDEQHPLQGQSPYAASKIAADQMARAFHLSFGLPVVTVRPFNTYGPGQSARAIVPAVMAQALTGDEIGIGNLHPTRDLTYVADTVEGLVLAAEADPAIGEVINLGTGMEVSMGNLVERILRLVGKAMPMRSDPRRIRPDRSEVLRLCANNGKARRLLGWAPAHTLEEGLTKTLEWVRENLRGCRPETYVV